MGKLHKRHNWKSRQIVNTIIDESDQKKIKVDLDNESEHYDASNALVLPSAKRKTKVIKAKGPPVKLLSRKQRKKLEKIAERKEKNLRREALLEELKKVQADPKDMGGLLSLSTVQTMGRKKFKDPSYLQTSICNGIENTAKGKKICSTMNNSPHSHTVPKNSVKNQLSSKQSLAIKRKRDLSVIETSSSSEDEEDHSDLDISEKNTDKKEHEINNSLEETVTKDEEAEMENHDHPSITVTDVENENDEKGGDKKKGIKRTKKKNSDKSIKNECESSAGFNGVSKKLRKKKKQKRDTEKNKNISADTASSKNDREEKMEIKMEDQKDDTNKLCSSTPERGEYKRTFKLVQRLPEIQGERMKLPIISEEHAVMEAINENPVTIIVGPTGSGKTTQVPQFLYEAGYTSYGKMIGVTEPRRIAAMSMSERISQEMNLSSQVVSYQVRFEGNTTSQTEIKLMTDGILFQEVKDDKLLKKYSAIVIDEVHERTVHSDILLGLLSMVVKKRNKLGDPLKLIIMSATPRIEDFTQNERLFRDPKPPVIEIPSRMFKVNIHFNRRTEPEYCEAAYAKICQIHRRLPEGGILVFLTGQQEITNLCERLKKTFPRPDEGDPAEKSFQERIKEKKEKRNKMKKPRTILIPEINLNDFSSKSREDSKDSTRPQKKLPSGGESSQTEASSSAKPEDASPPDGALSSDEEDLPIKFSSGSEQPLWVLPLYSVLPTHKQKRVFQPPPEGSRMCVVATNVAETTLTIPNIKYVVDSGKIKEKIYDPVTGVSTFHVLWTSKASATQRAGRAGRVSEGFCYRLYSSAVYNDEFPEYSIPDIQKRPLDDVLLVLKALRVNVLTFPFPTPPNSNHLQESCKRLKVLGALKEDEVLVKKKLKLKKPIDIDVITPLGLSMTCLAMAPRFAKVILSCKDHEDILPYLVIIISGLTVREIFIEVPLGKKEIHPDLQKWAATRLKWGGTGKSLLLGDPLVLIKSFLEAEKHKFSFSWCSANGIRHSALKEVVKLRKQITEEINLHLEGARVPLAPGLEPPTESQAVLLCEALVLGSIEQVARRVNANDLSSVPKEDLKLWRNAYRILHSEKPVFVSSASVLHVSQPKYLIYQEIYESNKVYLRGITAVNEDWLLLYGGPLADLSPPLDVPQPRFDTKDDEVKCWRKGTFGPDQWEIGQIEAEFPVSAELFKWVAYFFLAGDLWPSLKPFVQYLHDPETLIKPIALRFRDKKESLIRAFALKEVYSAKLLEKEWKQNPNYLKQEYFDWFENKEKLYDLNACWPPLKEEKHIYI